MSWVVNVHELGGSMAEAVFPAWAVTVETYEEAVELEKEIYEEFENSEYDGEILVTRVEAQEPKSVEDALDALRNQRWFEHEDPEEAALNARVDNLMAGETEKLNGLFKDTYHKPAPVQHTFTRYPVEDTRPSYFDPGTGTYQDPFEYQAGDDDLFEDYTDEQLYAMSDDEFLAELHRRRNEKKEDI